MPRELLNANITHVSYVDKAANKKKFFLTKSEDAPVFEKEVKLITKADDAEQLVYGIVYEPETEDAHGDFMTAQEIEKAAHKFLKDARNMDTQHNFEAGAGEVVESYVAPADFEIGEQTIKKGSWVLVTKATDEVWEKIQKGEVTGYSMAGTAEVIEKAEDPVEDSETSMQKSFFTMMKNFFTGKHEEAVQKGAVKDKFHAEKKKREFFDALHIFEDFFYNEVWKQTPDVEAIKEAAIDFAELLTDIANSPDILKALGPIPEKTEHIEKAGKKISTKRLQQIQSAYDSLGSILSEVSETETEEEEVKKEEIQKMLDDALAPINEKLQTLEKAEEQTDATSAQTEDVVKSEDLATTVAEAIQKAVAPISERLEAVEKARGIAKSQETEVEKTNEEKSIWDGLL